MTNMSYNGSRASIYFDINLYYWLRGKMQSTHSFFEKESKQTTTHRENGDKDIISHNLPLIEAGNSCKV